VDSIAVEETAKSGVTEWDEYPTYAPHTRCMTLKAF
jgi:hypothetical protein